MIARSQNGLYQLVYQNDGNLVLCNNYGTAYWASGPLVNNPSYAMLTAGNGNIILTRNNGGNTYWNANNIAFGPGPYYPPFHWVLQDDGNFVRYAVAYGTPVTPSTPSVSTGTGVPVVSSHFNTIQ